MDWCSVYLTPQSLPKYIYLSPPLIFPTTYNGIRTKNRPVWISPGAAPIRWMGPIRNPHWEQKRTEGYVIVSNIFMLLWTNILVHVAQTQQTVHLSRARVAVLVDQKAVTALNTNISTASIQTNNRSWNYITNTAETAYL